MKKILLSLVLVLLIPFCFSYSVMWDDPIKESLKMDVFTNPYQGIISSHYIQSGETVSVTDLSHESLPENQICFSLMDLEGNNDWEIGIQGESITYKGNQGAEVRIASACVPKQDAEEWIEENSSNLDYKNFSHCETRLTQNEEELICLIGLLEYEKREMHSKDDALWGSYMFYIGQFIIFIGIPLLVIGLIAFFLYKKFKKKK